MNESRPLLLTGVLMMLVCAGCMTGAVVAEDLAQQATASEPPETGKVLRHTMNDIDGNEVDLKQYEGKVVLIVNVASKCGYTPQYAGLEVLYRKYKDQGFVILGFPANNFMGQEPGTNDEIKTFCKTTYGVTFPMFAKISVKGDDMAPLYKDLTSKDYNGKFGGPIKWNFNKFLVGREGRVIARFGSGVKPQSSELATVLEAALEAEAG